MKIFKDRKVLGTIVGTLVFIYCILFFTYAYYNWRSGNSTLNVGIEDITVEITMGSDINISNIGPVLDYNYSGNISNNMVGYTDFCIKSGDGSNVNVSLDIESISDNLKNDTFKYVLLKSNDSSSTTCESKISSTTSIYSGGTSNDLYVTEIVSGDFESFDVGSNFISSSLSLNEGYNHYRFIVYIDGTVVNNNEMQNNSLVGSLFVTESKLLNQVSVGSYVEYVGNNGCPEGHCDGTNANYVDDSNKGNCNGSRFNINGWRVGYVKNDSVYLVSAGAPECMCTNADGTTSDTSCADYVTTDDANVHINNLNNKALTYCNSKYAFSGVCDNTTAWALNGNDFYNMTGVVFGDYGFGIVGRENDLVGLNGGYWWYANISNDNYFYYWKNNDGMTLLNYSNFVYGVRPVIKLDPSVYIIGGIGTEADPYKIGKS